MPLQGMSEEAKQEVRRLYRNKSWGAVRITRELNRLHDEGKLPDTASERAVGRVLAKKLSESEWRRFDEVAWPDSFGTPDLPYASAAAVLELARVLHRPPLVPLAVWYWRTLQALPTAAVPTLHNIAAQLALAEDDDIARRAIGAAAVAGELGQVDSLGPFDASKPEDIERAIRRWEIVSGGQPPFVRQGIRELLEGRVKGTWFAEGGQDDEKG